MAQEKTDYDPRYLAGILLFNRGDFFEAHEVWESLWMDTAGPEKRFYQALIQAAVGLLHFCNGNLRGASKLYQSSKEYMQRYVSPFQGLDHRVFWQQMATCFAEILAIPSLDRSIAIRDELIPEITLDPPPATWPSPEDFVEDEDEKKRNRRE